MITVLHISDLHRTSDPHLGNDELIAAISSDATRWHRESISAPDVIVVSGDVIQGAAIADASADSRIKSQYEEATDLLDRLATEFVQSDRSKVIIVPGNHDVHWGRSKSAMNAIDCPKKISGRAFAPAEDVRWCWEEQQAYTITNATEYDSRLKPFRDFIADFYSDTNPNPVVENEAHLLFMEYHDMSLAVVGFSSWSGNDCFCHVGNIDTAALSASRRLIAESDARVSIAVWHHGIIGQPHTVDYMDQRAVHKLVDYGFQVGLHGHQHFPGAAPFTLALPNLTSIAVVGAGSFAVGDEDLPMGERRQFNIVEIDDEQETVTVHVRAMSSSGVFSRSHRDDFGGKSSIVLPLPRSARGPDRSQALADEALSALGDRRYEEALELSSRLGSAHTELRRKVEIAAYENMHDAEELVRVLDPPRDVSEATRLIAQLINLGRFDEAARCLDAASRQLPAPLVDELRDEIELGKLLS